MEEAFSALVLHKISDYNSISIDSFPFPSLSANELLLHMEYSTINPIDHLVIQGKFPEGPTPIKLGREGCGTVVKTGISDLATSLLGKRVAFRGSGCWAEYSVASALDVFPLLDEVSFEEAANLIINPVTVSVFIDKIKDGHKAVVQNAAASSVGKMLVKWCKINSTPLVNLVRRQDQVEILNQIGAEYVFNTSEEGWKEKAKKVCCELGVTIAFDGISGDATQDIAELVNYGGVVYIYGTLSRDTFTFRSINLIFQGIRIEGLTFFSWLYSKSFEERVEIGYTIQRSLKEVFGVEHSRTINLNELKDILPINFESSTTNNKILVRTRIE